MAEEIIEFDTANPELEHVATFDFNYDVSSPLPFDGAQNDNLLILRRRG